MVRRNLTIGTLFVIVNFTVETFIIEPVVLSLSLSLSVALSVYIVTYTFTWATCVRTHVYLSVYQNYLSVNLSICPSVYQFRLSYVDAYVCRFMYMCTHMYMHVRNVAEYNVM